MLRETGGAATAQADDECVDESTVRALACECGVGMPLDVELCFIFQDTAMHVFQIQYPRAPVHGLRHALGCEFEQSHELAITLDSELALRRGEGVELLVDLDLL